MNFKKFQLQEKIQSLISSGQSGLLLACIDVIDQGYQKNKDVSEGSFNGFDIIGFKGTSSIQDLLKDLDFSKSDDFHTGFKAKATQVKEHDKLNELIEKKTNVVITGHSLGAAVALYNFIQFRLDPNLAPKIKMLVCFGMPKVGSVEFLQTKIGKALSTSPQLVASDALHFIILKEGSKQDVVSTLPNSLHQPQTDLLDFVVYSALKPASMTAKFLGTHLHKLTAYRESLEHLLTGTQ